MLAMDGISRYSLPYDSASGWPIRRVWAASILVALLLGTFLAARRFGGNLDVALPPFELVTAAIFVLVWAVTARSLVRAIWADWLSAGALLLFAVALSFPGERAIDWLVWLSVLGVFLALQNAVGVFTARHASNVRPHFAAAQADRVFQQLIRSRTMEGHDVVTGTLVAEFEPGARIATVYVGFCPPFERLPHVELESSADATLVQALHNGAQIEVRQPRAAKTALTATIEIYATDAS
jgi:hypothetical protein